MKYMNDLDTIIKESKDIAVISHINPDADNLGSLTALSESLRLLDKNVYPICIDKVPYNLKFLYGIDKLTEDYENNYDLLFILDSADADRLGEAKSIMDMADKVIAIDHHISNDMDVDYMFLDVGASSTGEILFEFLKTYNLPIDKNIAESIFTAIVGDSGSFRYDTVSKKTFEIAAQIMDYNIDKQKIDNNLYGSKRIQSLKILQRVLERMKFHEDKDLIISYVLVDDYLELEAEQGDIEGIIETLRDIDGVEIAILLKETKENFKASSRSKSAYDVRILAEKFGGGGHKKAAGFTVESKNVEDAIDKILEKI